MITPAMPAKVRQMFHRERLSAREIACKTGLSCTTVDRWLKLVGVVKAKYAVPKVVTRLNACAETLTGWLKTNQHRSKRDRRTVHPM